MSAADKLLEQMDITTHEHVVSDSDKSFRVDPFTRRIIADSGQKTILIQGEHKSEIFTFTVPRFIEGHDMASCNKIYIPYINIEPEGKNPQFKSGVYTVSGVTVNADTITFSWEITINSTSIEGILSFMLLFSCMEGSRVEYRWETDYYDEILIKKSLYSNINFENEYVDIIEQWKESVTKTFKEYVDAEVDSHIAVAKAELESSLKADFNTYSGEIDKNIEAFDGILETELKKMSDELALQKSRMDTFTSLKEGSTTGDAEISDIRVGWNGKTYNNAGEAVRGQFDTLNFTMDYFHESLETGNIVDLLPTLPGCYNTLTDSWVDQYFHKKIEHVPALTKFTFGVNEIVGAHMIAIFKNGIVVKDYYLLAELFDDNNQISVITPDIDDCTIVLALHNSEHCNLISLTGYKKDHTLADNSTIITKRQCCLPFEELVNYGNPNSYLFKNNAPFIPSCYKKLQGKSLRIIETSNRGNKNKNDTSSMHGMKYITIGATTVENIDNHRTDIERPIARLYWTKYGVERYDLLDVNDPRIEWLDNSEDRLTIAENEIFVIGERTDTHREITYANGVRTFPEDHDGTNYSFTRMEVFNYGWDILDSTILNIAILTEEYVKDVVKEVEDSVKDVKEELDEVSGTISKRKYTGKKLSIYGDSISTFVGHIPEGNAIYYYGSNCGVGTVNDTWWKKVLDATGMELLVNNSWSGRCVSKLRDSAGGTLNSGGYRSHNVAKLGVNGMAPDVIIVKLGINDFNNGCELGVYDGSQEFPTDAKYFRESYAMMLNEIMKQFPLAEVWCCTLMACERNGAAGFPEHNRFNETLLVWNDAIKELADLFGAKVLDHNACGITYYNMFKYMGDYVASSSAGLHPNAAGHSLMANKTIDTMDNGILKRY